MHAPPLADLCLHPYRLPLRRPWVSARGNFRERRGWLIVAEANGVRGYGDCAPLPEAGTETPEAAAPVLNDQRARLIGLPLDAALEALAGGSPWSTPAAHHALDCALLDLQSRLAGVPLRRWLDGTAGDGVPVNAALGPLLEVTQADLRRAAAAGFRVLKLKVGIGDPGREIQRLVDLAEALPGGLTLRLDANGAWDAGTAARMIGALKGLPVESLEEPLARSDRPALACLQAMAPFPLALDESIATLSDGPAPEHFPVRRVVLKPAVLGGLTPCLSLARQFQAAGVEVVITSLVESAAGLWATAQLAAAIASPVPQGLATADWLREDLGVPPRPLGGRIALPDSPGSGFELAGPRSAP